MASSATPALTQRDSSKTVAASRGPAQRNVPAWVKMGAGVLGGVAEACALQPLDVAKTRLQLDKTGQYKGLLDCTRTIARTEGPKSLYKGLSPFIMHLTLKYALRFGAFGAIKNAIAGANPHGSEAARNFTAGLAAGLIEAVLIVTPFEVVKTRLQAQKGTTNLKYRGPLHTVTVVAREEGPRALWNGCVPTMLRQGSNQAFNFMAFSFLQEHVFGKTEGDGEKQALWKPFFAGLLASTIGPLCNCPLDVAKTRLMAQAKQVGVPNEYDGFVDCIRKVYQQEGAVALWKGIGPRLARLAPGQAITWTVVSSIQSWYERTHMQPAASDR